jgi:hypothetical protein
MKTNGQEMSHPIAPIPSSPAGRSEQLARLVYELLDAHADTEKLGRQRHDDPLWAAHLAYLRDLQRVGREILAHVC